MLDMEISYSYDGDVLLGTGGAIKNASSLLDDKFMITYGDSYLDFDYAALETTFEKTNYSAMMTIFENNDELDKSNVIFEDGKLKLYSKKNYSDSMKYIDYGLTIVRKNIFDNIKKGDIFDFSLILENLSNKNKLGAFQVPKRFYEIGSFQGIKDLEIYLNIKI
jgi:hypothetical protein